MASDGSKETYLNPVYGRSFPDPFVLKHRGVYYAYSTGFASDGHVFPLLRSDDLVNWVEIGGAMQPLDAGEPFYWAPEVTYHNGKFYLYYSVGNETLMTLRVAVSARPDGGFLDAGIELTKHDFAIDPHVFRDDDGSWWMFYATDFLEHSRIGTGTVVDRMNDMFTLAGDPRPVTRAKYDWQIYDPARKEKGGVRWHTVEGPFVMKRKGLYYEMFSGGNWQNISYGVSVAVSDSLAQDEWHQYSDGEKNLPLLRTIPSLVVGPGHNSVIRGPNNRELYCVYHRWDDGERVLAVDRMDFAGGEQLFVIGATHTPQPAPYRPSTFIGEVDGRNEELAVPCSFLCETNFKGQAKLRLVLRDDSTASFDIGGQGLATWHGPEGGQGVELEPGFDIDAWHVLRLDVDQCSLSCRLDGMPIAVPALSAPVDRVASDTRAGSFSGITITEGFEDLFESDDLYARGWTTLGRVSRGSGHLIVDAGSLTRTVQAGGEWELAINLAWDKQAETSIDCGSFFRLTNTSLKFDDEAFELPAGFSSEAFHQFRFVCRGSVLYVHLNTQTLATAEVRSPEALSISSVGGVAKIDMVRFTRIGNA